MWRLSIIWLVLALPTGAYGEVEVSDPLEAANRPIFEFNRALDRWIFTPVARGYAFLVPPPGRRSVQNFFSNLDEPVTFVNDVLQLEPKRAGAAGARFLLNSSLGIAGFFDPAEHLGLLEHRSDFGETLGRTGLGTGPYLVIPLMGPSSARDAIGSIVDGVLRIDTWLLSPGGRLLILSGEQISVREDVLDEVQALEDSSVDFYAVVRHLYFTTRGRTSGDASPGTNGPPP